MKKIIKIFILIFIIFNIAINTSNAGVLSNTIDKASSFISDGTVSVAFNDSKTKELSNVIYNILFIAGVVIAVGVSAILGIKFIMGSAEEKAEIQKDLVPFIIGCVAMFASFAIWKAIVLILNSVA